MKSLLSQLQRLLITSFDLNELRSLALALGLNFEELGGDESLSARARELVLVIGRQRRWQHLLEAIKEERPAAFEQDQLSTEPAFIEQLTAEFDSLAKTRSDRAPEPIRQTAGDKAIQIGQNFGQVIVNNLSLHLVAAILLGTGLLLALALAVWTYVLQPDEPALVTATAPTNSASPTATSPPLASRSLEPFRSPILADTHLEVVAASGGVAWFGAREGLFVYQEEEEARQVVEGPVTAVAANAAGSAWFGLASEDGPRFGLYRLDSGQVEWFTAAVPLDPAGVITAITAGEGDLLWLGDNLGNVYRFAAESGEGQQLPAPPTLPVIHVYSQALETSVPETLWVVGDSTIYRWQADQWVTNLPHSEVASGLINAVAAGVEQRAWFGHARGVTLFQDRLDVNIRQECAVPDLPSTLVTDLVTTKGGQELWLVSRGGLAWLDARPEATPPGSCDDWLWQTWTEDSFWQSATAPGLFRLAVDENRGGEPMVYVVRQGTGRVRWLRLANLD